MLSHLVYRGVEVFLDDIITRINSNEDNTECIQLQDFASLVIEYLKVISLFKLYCIIIKTHYYVGPTSNEVVQ